MRVRVAIPDRLIDAGTLDALLEATTRAGVRQLQRGDAPDIRAAIKRGLKWMPERFVDGEHFDLPATAHKRGWGDCDDLAPWLAATLRATGEDPRAKPVAIRSGPTRWHIRVKRGDGSIEDPSIWAGMRSHVSGPAGGVCGLAAPPIALPGDGSMMLLRDQQRRGWWGRCDLPWSGAHVASVAPGRTPERALYHAVSGALDCADGVDPVYADYAARIAHDLLSHPYPESFLARLAQQHRAPRNGAVVGFLGALLPMAAKMAGGMGGGGGGGGGAPSAPGGAGTTSMSGAPIQITNKAKAPRSAHLPGGGHIAWQPQGPIIVRF